MCETGKRDVRLDRLKIHYENPLETLINVKYAEEGHNLDIPILVGDDYVIIDGHHRYWYFKKNKQEMVTVIKIPTDFHGSSKWRRADVYIKSACRLLNNDTLHRAFKELVYTLQ